LVVSAAPAARHPADPELLRQAAARARELAVAYDPPDFDHVPNADAALFLCAIDHRTGYRRGHLVDGRGPFEGSALLWELACAEERRRPGLLSAQALRDVDADEVERLFRTGEETASRAGERARLWRDLAAGLLERHRGSATVLLDSCRGRLGGSGGLVAELARFEAYSDPLQKKSFLFAKIAERCGWLDVADPENWQVCADNVLMRLALRAGLVQPGDAETVRAATRDALRRLAEEAGISPPILDDLLWERGREDPDLLGTAGGDLSEPPRPAGTVFY
jgi:hypothetical protein